MKAKGKKILAVAGAIPALGVLATSVALAAECPSWAPDVLCSTSGYFDVTSIIKVVLYLVIAAGVLWSLWNIIRAGFEYSSAGDDAEKKKKAQQRIISAVVGLVIVVLSFTILSLVAGWFTSGNIQYALNEPCITDDGMGGHVRKDNNDWQCCALKSDGSLDTGNCNNL